jgi:hypothetical protein
MNVDAALKQNIAELKAADANAPIVLLKIVNEIARSVRADATRHGHRVGIRVVQRTNGVRITVTGPHASRYRAPVEKAMRDRAPGAEAEIRVMLTRRAK